MTKIKNTKKGMAKKTLSISLAVAMLATSNVPVWAAEFTDGTDAAFTSEAVVETPVVEEEAAPEADASSTTNNDAYDETNLDLSKFALRIKNGTAFGDNVNGKEIEYGTTLGVNTTENIYKFSDGKALQDYSYGYRIKDGSGSIKTGTITDGQASNMGVQIKDDTNVKWSDAINKTVELYIFKEDSYGVFHNVVISSFKVVPKKVTGTINLKIGHTTANKDADGNYSVYYKGKPYTYSAEESEDSISIESITRTVNGQTENVPVDHTKYDVAVMGTAKNAGDEMTISVTPKAHTGLEGKFETKVRVLKEASKSTKAETYLNAELTENLEYEYTGSNTLIEIPENKVVVKEDGYANATLPQDVIKKVTVDASNKGEKTATVTLDADKVTNFDISESQTLTTADPGFKVNIKARDLSKVKMSLGFDGKPLDYVPEGLRVSDFYKYLVFHAADGTALKLSNTTDYTYTIRRNATTLKNTDSLDSQGVYTVTIYATENGNCVNSIDFDFEAGKATSGAKSDNLEDTKFYYTGSEIKPGKDVIGNVEILGKHLGAGETVKPVATIDTNAYEIVGYKRNTDVAKSGEASAAVTIKVTRADYKDRIFDVPFTISPLQIDASTVTVPKVVSYNKLYTKAEEYKLPLVVTAKNPAGTIKKGLSEKDFTVSYKFIDSNNNTADAKNEIDDKIQSTVSSTNSNFVVVDNISETATPIEDNKLVLPNNKLTMIVAKALTDSMVKVNPSSYTYTGDEIVPNYYVEDEDGTVLYDQAEYGDLGEYKFVRCEENLNVGTAKVVVEGVNKRYSGQASSTFEITPADTKDVKVKVNDQFYTGRQVRPRMDQIKVTLNGVDVTKQFEVVNGEYGTNVSGKGTVVLKPVHTTKNFTGANVTAEFNIVKEIVSGKLYAYDADGVNVTEAYTQNESVFETLATFDSTKKAFDFDGTEKTFKEVLLKELTKVEGGLPGLTGTKATAADFEIKYADNIAGRSSKLTSADKKTRYNIGYVYAVGKDGSGFAGNQTIVLADGSKITGVVAKIPFAIKNVEFVEKNVTVTNGTYAGGLIVKPNVLVQINGHTLVEGKDYTLKLKNEVAGNHFTDYTNNKKLFKVDVIGKGGYEGSKVENIAWGIDKKDLKDCDVKVVNGVAYVMNGYIPVPTTEYTVKENDDKTYTVTANEDSKNYTGSKTVVAEGQKPTDKPETPMIQSVKVVGNKATVILSGETEGAVGYDYVISTDKDCINNKDYDKVNKNILNTTTDFTYVGQDVYYAYCHAWKRGEDGKKIFSDWSNAYPFVVSAITPSQPAITSVKVKGSTVTVTYTKSSNADGYDVVLGSKVATVAGEKRPVEYGKLVKKNIKGNTVTATFKNVKKGTYYAGLHAFNRTSEDGKKVFSPWSNVKRVTVK